MMHYGEDFRSGRYTRAAGPYDGHYRSGNRAGGWRNAHPNIGRGVFRGGGAEGSRGDLDESWGSMAHGRGRPDFDGERHGPRRSTFAEGFRGPLPGSYGARQAPYDRGYQRFGGRIGQDYDEDLGERVRRGWTRIRSEAREWMGGRGYDRAW